MRRMDEYPELDESMLSLGDLIVLQRINAAGECLEHSCDPDECKEKHPKFTVGERAL